ncbi:hypothetical protein CEXT_166011 [Caerostris extrusa]|uniref:Uncharacterized protein n=1 Tax=Caerostris extrusa TaxID=172846 RepID=A0AAV4V779_CAEEX|nr:hypothetical protein CEXT_166011 [Caerostris extrusa]
MQTLPYSRAVSDELSYSRAIQSMVQYNQAPLILISQPNPKDLPTPMINSGIADNQISSYIAMMENLSQSWMAVFPLPTLFPAFRQFLPQLKKFPM